MIAELRNDASGLNDQVGKVVAIRGRVFVMSDDSSRLAASYEAFRSGEIIELDDKSAIAKSLLAMLPVSGGGHCLYDEECLVTGKLIEVDGRKRLVDIVSCSVTDEDGNEHRIRVL